jgi:hypothetical protein
MRDKEDLRLPGDVGSKLPLPPIAGLANLPEELRRAWIDHMVQGFRQNQIMFDRTLKGFTNPYWLTVWLYSLMFLVGLGLFVTAAIIGVRGDSTAAASVFGGLGVATFVAFFLQRPLQSLEENLQFITALAVAFNTYWSKLMYLQDPRSVVADLKAADEEFRVAVERLIELQSQLREKRPGTTEEK